MPKMSSCTSTIFQKYSNMYSTCICTSVWSLSVSAFLLYPGGNGFLDRVHPAEHRGADPEHCAVSARRPLVQLVRRAHDAHADAGAAPVSDPQILCFQQVELQLEVQFELQLEHEVELAATGAPGEHDRGPWVRPRARGERARRVRDHRGGLRRYALPTLAILLL